MQVQNSNPPRPDTYVEALLPNSSMTAMTPELRPAVCCKCLLCPPAVLQIVLGESARVSHLMPSCYPAAVTIAKVMDGAKIVDNISLKSDLDT